MPSIAKLLLRGLKSQAKTLGLKKATLARLTAGTRTPGAVGSGTNPTTASYACFALIELATVANMPGTTVRQDDRKIGIPGASCKVAPRPGDRITLADIDGVTKTLTLAETVESDGVGAFYEFLARK